MVLCNVIVAVSNISLRLVRFEPLFVIVKSVVLWVKLAFFGNVISSVLLKRQKTKEKKKKTE